MRFSVRTWTYCCADGHLTVVICGNFDSFLQNDAPIRIPVTADGKGFRLLIPKWKQPEQFFLPRLFFVHIR
jgi:hypothetical protein